MLGRRISIKGWGVGHAADIEDFIRFSQVNNLRCLVETFPLEKAQEAYNRRSSAQFRAVIVPDL